MTSPRTALVIGAGVVGVTTAYALARRGVAVTLLDKGHGPGQGTSFANGAQLSYQYTEALASPYLRPTLPSIALGRLPAFRFRPSIDPDFWLWMATFLRNCTHARWATHTLQALSLGLESQAEMARLFADHPLDFTFHAPGKLHIYHSAESFAAALDAKAIKKTGGAEQRTISLDEAIEIEPAIAGLTGSVVGFIHTPTEEVGDAHLFCRALTDTLVENYNVKVETQTTIDHIETTSEHSKVIGHKGDAAFDATADLVVVCTGHDAPALLKPHGVRLPIIPMKGYSITLPATEASPTVSITDTYRRIVIARLGDKIRIAGLAEIGARSNEVDPSRVDLIRQIAMETMPTVADFEGEEDSWAGLRPMTPDSLPRIGLAGPRLAYNAGHGMLGWTLALGSAERLVQKLALTPVS